MVAINDFCWSAFLTKSALFLKFAPLEKKTLAPLPIAMILAILQGEEKAYMGRLLPMLAGVLIKLKFKRNNDFNYYLPLLDCLIQRIELR